MFGSKGLRTGTKFFAIWWHAQLVVKLPAAQLEQLVGRGEAEPFEPMPGRPMNGWAVVPATADWSARELRPGTWCLIPRLLCVAS
jgi:hypothetical protein